MREDYFEMLSRRLASTLERGQLVAVVGWLPRNHSNFTRQVAAAGTAVFLESPIKGIPRNTGLALLTSFVGHRDNRKIDEVSEQIRWRRSVLGTGEIKRLLQRFEGKLIPRVKKRRISGGMPVVSTPEPMMPAVVLPVIEVTTPVAVAQPKPPEVPMVAVQTAVKEEPVVVETIVSSSPRGKRGPYDPRSKKEVVSTTAPTSILQNLINRVEQAQAIIAGEGILVDRQKELGETIARLAAEKNEAELQLETVWEMLAEVANAKVVIANLEAALAGIGGALSK